MSNNINICNHVQLNDVNISGNYKEVQYIMSCIEACKGMTDPVREVKYGPNWIEILERGKKEIEDILGCVVKENDTLTSTLKDVYTFLQKFQEYIPVSDRKSTVDLVQILMKIEKII